MNKEREDYYKILELEEDASEEDIKKAFRKMALRYHPDKNNRQDAAKCFQQVAEAYEVLSNSHSKDSCKRFQDCTSQINKTKRNDKEKTMFYSSDHFVIFSSFDDLFSDQYYEKTSLHGNSVRCSVTTVYTTREGKKKDMARTVVGEGGPRRRRNQSLATEASERYNRCSPDLQTKVQDQITPEKQYQGQRVKKRESSTGSSRTSSYPSRPSSPPCPSTPGMILPSIGRKYRSKTRQGKDTTNKGDGERSCSEGRHGAGNGGSRLIQCPLCNKKFGKKVVPPGQNMI